MNTCTSTRISTDHVMSPRLPYLTLALALAGAAPVFAHEGHDHGEAPLPPASYEPRFEAHAGEIEVVDDDPRPTVGPGGGKRGRTFMPGQISGGANRRSGDR